MAIRNKQVTRIKRPETCDFGWTRASRFEECTALSLAKAPSYLDVEVQVFVVMKSDTKSRIRVRAVVPAAESVAYLNT